jgi:hypothetical protein
MAMQLHSFPQGSARSPGPPGRGGGGPAAWLTGPHAGEGGLGEPAAPGAAVPGRGRTLT